MRDLAARSEVVGSSHGYAELDKDGILFTDLLMTLPEARLVEDYPDAVRGPSVLVLHALSDGGAVHAVWGIRVGRPSPAVLITSYRPDPERWSADLLIRRPR